MSMDKRFRLDILNNPQDDAARLVYADWLEERGNPRAEFIRLQFQLDQLPEFHSDRVEIEMRIDDLLVEHELEWVGELADHVNEWEFRNGFVERIRVHPQHLVENPRQFFEQAPILHLNFSFHWGWFEQPCFADFLKLPQLAQINGLNLSHSSSMDLPQIESLVNCSQLSSLRYVLV
ncbi:MAG: TIGR02996 domain-containing protein [Planctomycetales bacterium]